MNRDLCRACRFAYASGNPWSRGDGLRPAVTANVGWRAALVDSLVQSGDEVLGLQRAGHRQADSLPGKLVDQRQDPQRYAVVSAVGHEVPAPDVVGLRGYGRKLTGGLALAALS